MFTILAINGWLVLDSFVRVLIPISVIVVLPIMIVWLVIRSRQATMNKQTELLLKAMELGQPLDSSLMEGFVPKKKSAKDKVIGYLAVALPTGIIGLLASIAECVVFLVKPDIWDDSMIVLVLGACIFLAIGLGFFFVYLISKKVYAKELAEEREQQ